MTEKVVKEVAEEAVKETGKLKEIAKKGAIGAGFLVMIHGACDITKKAYNGLKNFAAKIKAKKNQADEFCTQDEESETIEG